MKTVLIFLLLGVFALAFSALPHDGAAADDAQAVGHDVAVASVEVYGPAAVNISDTNGRYMWVAANVANYSDHAQLVNVSLSIPEPVPAGCERQIQLIVPGRSWQTLAAGGDKDVIWRVRYECHAPAMFSVVKQSVTVGVTHCDPSTSTPGPVTSPTPGGVCPPNSQPVGAEGDLSNNVVTVESGVLVR